jgi:hypothetical protein
MTNDTEEPKICAPNTGKWFLEDSRYMRWKHGNLSSNVLWCYGNLGSGKTVMA